MKAVPFSDRLLLQRLQCLDTDVFQPQILEKFKQLETR